MATSKLCEEMQKKIEIAYYNFYNFNFEINLSEIVVHHKSYQV